MANMFVGTTFQAVTFKESEGGPNPYSIGTAKRTIFGWCLAQTDGFSKQEFYDFVLESLSEGRIISKMKTPETTAGAWFSELKNKAKAFEIIEA